MHAEYMRRFFADAIHVIDVRADVVGHDEAPAERIDEAAEGPQHRLALVFFRIADDHGLAAPEIEARERRLVGHGARTLERIALGVRLPRIGPHAQTAERG